MMGRSRVFSAREGSVKTCWHKSERERFRDLQDRPFKVNRVVLGHGTLLLETQSCWI